MPFENIASYFGYSESFQTNYRQTKTKIFLPAREGDQFEFDIKTNWFKQLPPIFVA